MSPAFDRVLIIFFENENAVTVLQNSYFAKLAAQGVQLTGYHGVTHPSQPNYIATIGGNFFGWADDSCTDFDKPNLVDLLEAQNITWGVYMQNLPDNKLACYGPNISEPDSPLPGQVLYYRKHNPFVSFKSNQTAARLVNIVDASQFKPASIPQFCWYGPNIANCGHTVPNSTGSAGGSLVNVNYAAQWLQSFLDPLLHDAVFMDGTLVVLTFDEDYPQKCLGDPETGLPIYTVLLGKMVKPGTTQPGAYTHYNLLATIEKNFGLGTLGQKDQGAATFDFLWS